MEFGDLIEVLIAMAIVGAGLLGGKKKKPQQRRPPPARQPPRERMAPTPRMNQHQATGSDELLAELARQLQFARGEVVVEDMPEAVSLETMPEEARSLETLEAAGGASHDRFHEQYIRPLREVVSEEARVRQPPGGTRAAIVWAEILGPPKGLQG